MRVARTASRSVLGFMTDSAGLCVAHAEAAGGVQRVDVLELNRRLRRHLHNVGGCYDDALSLVKQHAALAGESARTVHGSGDSL